MKFSDRLGKLAPYPFVEISRIIAAKRAAGADVVTFGIGDPDIPTPQPIIDRLLSASQYPPNHRYPETDGLPEMRRAIAEWYDNRFGVKLDPDTEVLPLIGAKEGIGHAAFCFLDPRRYRLVPDPAYPVYGVGTMFAGAESYIMPLYERNGWLPELGRHTGRRGPSGQGDVAELPQQPHQRRRHRRGPCLGHSLLPGERHRIAPRRRLQRGRLRWLPSRQFPSGRRVQGYRNRVPFAVQDLQHDRLAHGWPWATPT